MKTVILLTVLTMLLTGCMNLKETDTSKTITIVEKIDFAKDGKTPKSKTKTTTTTNNNKTINDESFTVGSKGFGSYSFFRDISFM